MERAKHKRGVFDWIAPVYALFYKYQVNHYNQVFDGVLSEFNLPTYKSVIDIGCGTGALCSVLHQRGLEVTGVDSALGMLRAAQKKSANKEIEFIQANILKGLPWSDKRFDIAVAAYVAHGLQEGERKIMYAEMRRITKHLVLIFDYNNARTIFTDLIELLEGGDYFNFINRAQIEMRAAFTEVRVIDVGSKASCYLCSI